MKRRDVLKGVVATAAWSAAAPSIGKEQGSRTLKFVPQADLSVVDPVMSAAFVTRNHAAMVFDSLYGVDENYVARPQMVAGHTIENEGKTWDLTLRDGLRFHDGTPVLARDVVASVKRWGARDAWAISMMEQVDGVSALSDGVVRFRMKRPYRLLPDALGKPGGSMPAIMPERLATTSPTTALTEIIGSGPYRFVATERVPGAKAVYARFDGYQPRREPVSFLSGGKVAHFDRIEWLTMPDASTAAAALQSGEIDWWEQPTGDLLPLFKGKSEIKVDVLDPAGLTMMIRMNHLQPPFDNAAIRRALLGGIVQADYLNAAMGDEAGAWKDGVGFFTPGTALANGVAMENLTGKRDLAKVKSDLAAAGYKGERVVLLAPSDFPILNAMSEVAADYLRKIGMSLDYQATDWGTMVQRLNSKEAVDKKGWSLWLNYAAGAATVSPAAHTYLRSTGEKAIWGWPRDARLEELRDAWVDAADPAEQKRIAEEIQRRAFETLPYIPLGTGIQSTAYRSDLTGILKGFPLFYNVRRT